MDLTDKIMYESDDYICKSGKVAYYMSGLKQLLQELAGIVEETDIRRWTIAHRGWCLRYCRADAGKVMTGVQIHQKKLDWADLFISMVMYFHF